MDIYGYQSIYLGYTQMYVDIHRYPNRYENEKHLDMCTDILLDDTVGYMDLQSGYLGYVWI
jgi:hypothetical protein